jgi:hypothetical protein
MEYWMKNRKEFSMNKIKFMGIAFLCLILTPLSIAAAQFDGSVPLLCAVIQIVECEAGGDCYPVQPEVANIPRFLKINFKKKTISATEETGRKGVTQIKNIDHVNGNMILQGSENGRGWTMVISEDTGKMSATVSDDQVGFVVFGASTKF